MLAWAAQVSAINVKLSDTKVSQGSSVTLTPQIDADGDFTCQWVDRYGNVVGEEPTLTVSPSQLTHYRLNVTDAEGNTASAKSIVYVIGDAVTATFEDAALADSTAITLDSESTWIGYGEDDYSTGVETEWYSGSYMFPVRRYTSTWWYGYGLTNQTANVYEDDLTQQWRSAPGGPYAGTNFCVAYPYSFPWGTYEGEVFSVYVTNSEDGDTIRGAYVTNTPYANNSIINGDDFGSVAFAQGDYFILVATGYNGTAVTDTLKFYLADYTSSNANDRYTLKTWQWFDLRALGKVTSVALTFETTQANEWGALTPLYVAIDNFNGEREITDQSTLTCQVGTTTYALSSYFTFASDSATVTYTLETESVTDGITLSVDDSGNLVVVGTTEGATATVVVEAFQAGIRQFVRIPVTISNSEVGITSVSIDANLAVYPVPVTESLNIATGLENYTVEIFSTNGSMVYRSTGNSGSVTVERGGMAPGVYLLKVSAESGSTVKRIIVK